MDYFFKSRGYAYAYYLITFTGSQLYKRLNITYKHYQDKREAAKLIDKIKNIINQDIKENNLLVTEALTNLDNLYIELLGES